MADFALFAGQPEVAAAVVSASRAKRIATEIEPDGSQPRELARTRPFHYSAFNLAALFCLASFGAEAGVDLWNFSTADGRGVRAALDFLLPYTAGSSPWPYPEFGAPPFADLAPMLAQAATVYGDDAYRVALAQLQPNRSPWAQLKLSLGGGKADF